MPTRVVAKALSSGFWWLVTNWCYLLCAAFDAGSKNVAVLWDHARSYYAAVKERSAGLEPATFTIRVLRSTCVFQDGLVPGVLQCRGEDPPEVTPLPVISTLTLPTTPYSDAASWMSWRSSPERSECTEAAAFASTCAGALAPGIATETAGW